MHFVNIHNLTGPHSARVTCLDFSTRRALLATADDDGTLVIWEVESGSAEHVLTFKEGITAVAWDTVRQDRLFVGLETGVIRVVDGFQGIGKLVKTGVIGAPVHALAASPYKLLAGAIGEEVHVIREIKKGIFITFDILPSPEQNPPAPLADNRIRPRSLHFLESTHQLVVSYLNHGLICWDLDSTSQRWSIAPTDQRPNIGFSLYLPRLDIIAFSDMRTGVAMYSTQDLQEVGTLEMPLNPERNLPMIVAGLDATSRLVCGGHDGEISVWRAPNSGIMQRLKHSRDGLVQCIAAQSYDDFEFIASTVSEANPTVKLWKARLAHSLSQRIMRRSWIQRTRASKALVFFSIAMAVLSLTLHKMHSLVSKDAIAFTIVWFISAIEYCARTAVRPLEWLRACYCAVSGDLKALLVEWIRPARPEPAWVDWLPMPESWLAQMIIGRFYDNL